MICGYFSSHWFYCGHWEHLFSLYFDCYLLRIQLNYLQGFIFIKATKLLGNNTFSIICESILSSDTERNDDSKRHLHDASFLFIIISIRSHHYEKSYTSFIFKNGLYLLHNGKEILSSSVTGENSLRYENFLELFFWSWLSRWIVRILDNFRCFGTEPSSCRGPGFTPGLDVGYSCLNLLHSWSQTSPWQQHIGNNREPR